MKISLKTKLIAVVTVALHLFTFSLPTAFAELVVLDSQGNQVSQTDGTNTVVNLAAGNTYHTQNADINVDQNVIWNVLNAQGLADATAKAIVEILGDQATTWAGASSVTGIIAFLNDNGFNITDTFQGNVNGGVVLSSLGMNQADFFNGLTELAKAFDQEGASIINKGNWNVSEQSFLAMVASAIDNQGQISANGGAVAMAVGDKVKLDLTGGNDLISVSVDKPVDAQVIGVDGNPIKDGIKNSGSVKADAGFVILTAAAKENVFDTLVNHSGIIEANTISNKGGQIILDGGDQGIVSVTGTLNAKGDDLGEKGGLVQVLGNKVGLFGGSTVDVSGYNGGGTALIGGDYQGLGSLRTAAAAYVDPFAVINADALLEGDGGKIVVWSNEYTGAHGILSAKGGLVSGNGGLIETSSKNSLNVDGLVADASAINGNAGVWLIDPINTTISNNPTTNGSFNGANPDVFTPTAVGAIVQASQVNSRLNAGTNVKITTVGTGTGASGTILLDAAATIGKTLGAHNVTLTLEAAGGITLSGIISATSGIMNVILTTLDGTVTFSNAVNTNGGNLTVNVAGNNDVLFNNAAADINTSGGFASFIVGDDFNMNNGDSSITTAGGQVDITANDAVVTQTINTGAGNVNLTATTGNMSIGSALTTTSGNITANAADNITLSSAVMINTSGGDFTANANTDADSVGTFQQGAGGSTINTGNGNISIIGKNVSLDGALVTTGSGNIGLTATNGDVDLTQTLTTVFGDININADNGFRLNGANADLATSGGDININANTDGDADGDFDQNSATSTINTAGGNVSITANDFKLTGTTNAGAGDVSLLGAQAGSTYLVGTGSSAGFTGTITGTEMQNITANNLTIGGSNVAGINVRGITAANSNNAAKVHVNAISAGGNVTFDAAASTFNSLDVNAGNNVTFSQDVSTDSGSMTVASDSDASGAGAFTVDAGRTLSTNGSSFLANSADTFVNGAINTGTGAINGGNITINGSNQITISATGSLNTSVGAGGIFSAIGAVTVNGAITLGQGNIILNGGGASPDLIITVPIISATSIFLSAVRDIIVQALLKTTNPADGNITLRADSDDDGVGGVWVQSTGMLDAAQNVNIIGSDLFAIAGTQESIQIDADGANDQVLAAGDITLQTAGFAPAGSDMNLNGIVKSTGVGKTITVNSVGNINTSNNGVAELISDNQSLNAVEGIDAEINAKNVSFNNSTSGNVFLEDLAGGLTVTGAINGGAGSTTILTHSPLTIAANMIQNGAINLTAGETAGAGDDLTVNNGVTVRSINDNVILKAGDNVNLGTGTVQSDAASVSVTAGEADMDGNGNISLAGTLSAFGNAILNAAQGGITQTTGAITAANLSFSAENNVALANAANNLAALTGSSSAGSINLGGSGSNTVIGNLTTTGKDITYNHSGAGSVDISGTLNSGNGVDGGNITVNNLGGLLTVKSTAVLTSQTGVGGIFTASNVTIEGGSAINLGLGNITLNGGGLDLIINVPIVSAVSIFLSALRDIIVQAGITTTNAADGHITLRADSDNDGVGGVWLQSTGFINSADDVNIMGSDLFAIPVTMESIQIDDNGGTQILAPNDITLQTTGFAPAGSNMNLNGLVNSTGVGKTVTVKSVGNINTSDNGVAELVGDNVDLQAVTGIDAEINGKNLSYSNTTSGNVSVEDMAGGLTVTGATNSGAGTTTITTHSPLTVATDIIQAGTVNLNAGEVAGAGDDFTLNAGKTVRSTAGDVNINAGDHVDLKLGSTVESTTGAVNVNAGFGDLDGLGNISVAFISAATNAVLNAVGAIRGVTDDNTADVSGANVNLTANAGGISGAGGAGALDVNVTTALAADTTNDNGNITIDSVSNLPLGLVNAGTGTVTLVSEGNMRDANDGGTPDAPAVTNIIGGTINLLAKSGGIGIPGNAVDFLASTQFNADTTTGSGGDDANINVRSTGNAPIGLIDAGTGDVRLTSEGNITDANDGPTIATWDNPGILNIHGGRIDLETVNGHDIGEFVNYLEIGPSTAWGANSHGGDIYIACIGPCPIDQVDLGTGTFYYTGNMVDFNDLLKGEDFGAIWNITAGGVHLDADNDPNGFIGSSTNWIETRLKNYGGVIDTPGRLVATSGTGGIHMSDDRDPLDLSIDTGFAIGGIAPATITNVTSTGDIELYSFSPITINASVNAIAGGNITLYALGTLPTDTMTVNANVQSSGGNGNIRMVSGGSMTMAPGTVISTQGDGVTSGTGQIFIGAGYDATGKAANEPATPGTTLSQPSSSLFDTVGDSSANLTMDETARIWTEGGDILVDVQNNFTVGRVDADGNAGAGITDGVRGDITTFSRNGSTFDAETPNEGNLDFVADTLTMFSGGLIGIGSNPIELDAPNFNAFAIDSIFATAMSNVQIELVAVQGSIVLNGIRNILLGHAAAGGSVSLGATDSILSQGGSDDRVIAGNNIQLTASGGVVGTASNPINTILLSPGGTLYLAAGGSIDGLSTNVTGNFPSGQVQFLSTPPGLALFNGIAIGGDLLTSFNSALSNIFVNPLPLMLPQFGQFDGRYTADFPALFNLQQFGTPLPASIDTTQLDTVGLPETVPPTVVPIPVPASAPAAPEKKQAPKTVPAQPKKTVAEEQDQNPPAIVPIPTEAKPTSDKKVENTGSSKTVSGTN